MQRQDGVASLVGYIDPYQLVSFFASRSSPVKRAATDMKGKRSGDVRKDLTENQLAWIGSVALSFNEAENIVDLLLNISLSLGNLNYEVTSRINGVDGKIELTKLAIRQLGPPEKVQRLLEETLGEGGLKLLKKYRDRIIHTRVIDAAAGIGKSPAMRGTFEEILLTPAALEGVYKRLEIVRLELRELTFIVTELIVTRQFELAKQNVSQPELNSLADKHKEHSDIEIPMLTARFQAHQKGRLSLAPLPEFPSESELREADARAMQERQAALMGWNQQWPASLPQRNNALLDTHYPWVLQPPPKEQE